MVRKRQHEQATTDQWPVDLGRIRFGLIGLFGQVFPIKYVINSKRFRLWANSPKLRERFRLLDLPAPQNLAGWLIPVLAEADSRGGIPESAKS